jgi:hypothetical protein
MLPDLSKEELILLRNQLAREMKYFYQSPREWDDWNPIYQLDKLDIILKKLDSCLQKEKNNETI